MIQNIFREIMTKNLEKEVKRLNTLSGMGMRKGFFGFFGGLPFSPWEAGMHPLGWQKIFQDSIVETTPSGAVRINPGVPKIESYSSPFSFSPYSFIKDKIYETAWKIGRVSNVSEEMKKRLIGDLNFSIDSYKRMYPFSKLNFNKVNRSINNALKYSKGSEIKNSLLDSIYVLDFLFNR
jgi:hypothetical protein